MMVNLQHLKHFSKYTIIYVDIDDTLIQTTTTLDRLSEHPIDVTKHPLAHRWVDFDTVVAGYNKKLSVPLYDGVSEFINLIRDRVRLISAAPDEGYSRANRINATSSLKLPIKFFPDDASKKNYLTCITLPTDLVVDDKTSILQELECHCILVNVDVNFSNGVTIRDILNTWSNR